MLEKKTRKCPLNDEIVSYMYGELDEGAAGTFETHLADCTVCTDEFAAVSNARFSVYEWQKEAFAPLATPQFFIPYEAKPAAQPTPGVFAGLRELFAFGRWPVGVAVGVLLALGLGFIAMNLTGGSEQQHLVANTSRSEQPAEPIISQPVTSAEERPQQTEKREVAVAAETRPTKMTRAAPPLRVNAREAQKEATTARAPALTNFDDEADTSLRLADLLDGIGS